MAFFHSNFMLQTPNHDHHHHHHHQHHPSTSLPPLIPPPNCTNPQEFHASLLGKRSSMSLMEDMNSLNNHGVDELSDDESQVGEKKRRLNMEQVRTLEKNFEMGNKLEPERKMQLARALGLQPRQVAIWFQNRRARWKTKQLEKDYDVLKRQFEVVKAENESLRTQNHKLHAEILVLKTREPTESINLNKETEGSCSNRSENTSEIKLDISTTATTTHHHDDSPSLSGRPGGGGLFTSSGLTPRPAPPSAVALFQNPAAVTAANKIDQNVKEESLCNMFCGMDDQTGFWPWLEQQHFN